ncbi:sphingomyelin phosphodiesterase 4 [Acyrthosiphon pisum]|uniref:Sphingomyelin phosphodiesterase 4 n=1 Tax=Acyrthosiphon pisum TaxID=7029 RepID=A0A8R1VZJ7_ACYPI|nr:sphingomyelin phosphodiesterase 4 [Acyrthosiphon pisum]|eukprot:XP_001945260.2 PREDICTED: sphingomyelin phosphodiesterase 4 [Acyrthosiphon pisum]
MHSPLFCNLPVTNTTLSSTLLASIDPKKTSYSLIERIKVISSYIDDANERDLYNIFADIIFEIFGRGSDKGWELDKLKTRISDEQKYICREPDSAYHFLSSSGHIFKLCYKLLSNNLLKFNIYFSDLPIELTRKIDKSFGQSYYGSRFLYHADSISPIGLNLNSFEYYMFHFAIYGLKLTSDDISNGNYDSNQLSVYKLLCLEYLKFFLPLDNSASMILPQIQFNVLSPIPNQKQNTSTSKLLNFIKKDVASNDLLSENILSSSWMLTSEATWRSEVVAFFFADIWLNCNVLTNASFIDLTKLIRCFIKHLHLYSNCAKHQPVDNLKLILMARHGIQIYQYLSYYMVNWPQDFSFRLMLENWLCYIQPWRYDDLSKQQCSITELEMNNKWRIFIIRNLLCYTKLFYLAIKRFICIDVCSPRYSIMVYRMLKVFTHPYLLKLVLDIEQMYTSNQPQHKKWNMLLSECLVEAEGPLFKYELMFSEERNSEYKLFYLKLQKSLDHVAVELGRYQEDQIGRNNSSMLELILTPRKNKMSDYTLNEWKDIQTNLKSSLMFMEQIINVNVTTMPMMADLSAWSTSGVSGNNTTSSVFNKSHSLIQSFERSTMNLSFRPVIRAKEWEIDPDYLEALSYENYFLVNLSKFLRNIVELYCNSQILHLSTENSIFAGVLRQALIRKPMKIFSYEPRNDGSGKRVRTPKILPPTISFRWMASYFTLFWILFLLTLTWVFNNTVFWIGLFYVLRILYLCLKYLIGYAPPFSWDNIHEN